MFVAQVGEQILPLGVNKLSQVRQEVALLQTLQYSIEQISRVHVKLLERVYPVAQTAHVLVALGHEVHLESLQVTTFWQAKPL